MKVPNFLHLTPPTIQKHCEELKKFCTEFPPGTKSFTTYYIRTQITLLFDSVTLILFLLNSLHWLDIHFRAWKWRWDGVEPSFDRDKLRLLERQVCFSSIKFFQLNLNFWFCAKWICIVWFIAPRFGTTGVVSWACNSVCPDCVWALAPVISSCGWLVRVSDTTTPQTSSPSHQTDCHTGNRTGSTANTWSR